MENKISNETETANNDKAGVSSSKNYGHIKAVTIQVHAEYGKEGRKVVHGHTFSNEELTTLLAEKRGIADYMNHLTKVLIYE